MEPFNPSQRVQNTTAPSMARGGPASSLLSHPALRKAYSKEWLEQWMESEVFALFAEANLAHALIGKMLRWDSVWVPSENVEASKLAVELAQEYELGRSFDVFVLAMKELGVTTQPIFRLMNAFREDRSLDEALENAAQIEPWVAEMVRTYFRLSERSIETMSGALFMGQNDEFLQSIRVALKQSDKLTPSLDHFFELRSQEQKSGRSFLEALCAQSDRRWKEVHQGADSLLFARELFLDGILARVSSSRLN